MTTPSKGQMMARGFARRCARCGSGKLFRGWMKMVPDCPRCGLHFERESGYFAGALAINMICVGGLIVLTLAAVMIATIPDIPVVPLIAVLATIAILGPIVWFPFSKTIWVAIDRAFLQGLDK
jgi:uncharacterized protein (DUF983 family)